MLSVSSVKLRYIKMTARKMRVVADSIRNCSVEKAFALLSVSPQKATVPIGNALKSAVSNCNNGRDFQEVNLKDLYIQEIKVDEGPTLKRWTPRAMGRTSPILKRTSHLSIRLAMFERKD